MHWYTINHCDWTAGHPNNVNTTSFRVSFFVLLFSLAINFLHACDGNMSIDAARNAWVGNFVCLCVMENKSCAKRWMVEGATTFKKGLRNWRWKVRLEGEWRSKVGGSFLVFYFSYSDYWASRWKIPLHQWLRKVVIVGSKDSYEGMMKKEEVWVVELSGI